MRAKRRRKRGVLQQEGGEEAVAERRSDGTFKNGNNPYSFKPGQSGNPAGRPRTALLSTAYKRWLGSECCDRELIQAIGLDVRSTWLWADVVACGMIHAAVGGKTTAAKEMREATEGNMLSVKPDWQGTLRDMGIDPEQAMQTLMQDLTKK